MFVVIKSLKNIIYYNYNILKFVGTLMRLFTMIIMLIRLKFNM